MEREFEHIGGVLARVLDNAAKEAKRRDSLLQDFIEHGIKNNQPHTGE